MSKVWEEKSYDTGYGKWRMGNASGQGQCDADHAGENANDEKSLGDMIFGPTAELEMMM